jgi:hypothetical protein
VCGYAFKLAADSFEEVLKNMLREFKIAKVDDQIENKLKLAKFLPFTDTPKEADELKMILTR